MALIFYNIFLKIYKAGIRIASIWDPKAKLWLAGREDIFFVIKAKLKNQEKKHVWMHCASLGEFEQGRPLLESIQREIRGCNIILTFFSPSGYEIMKNYPGADHVFYLPLDSPSNAKQIVDAFNPSLVLWVKYEFWFYYLQELKQRNIPTLLIAGVFRNTQPFFSRYGNLWRKMLLSFTWLFVQNDESETLLEKIGIHKNVSVSGDTRFDRVIEIAAIQFHAPIIEAFCQNYQVIVAGSTWEDDEIILAAYGDETGHREKIILVPHELDKPHLDSIKKIFRGSVLYSDIEKNTSPIENNTNYNTLIIDTMGILSKLYQYGDINYVGGGFTKDGVHNVLEAAVWGRPVIFGENYEKYVEAKELLDCLAAETISNTNELKETVTTLFSDHKMYDRAASAAKEYVFSKKGATKKIMKYLQENRLLTS